ncbi:protein phosphatase 2C [Trypanosoma rangeli]|uniref:Protein phosphatase 2C n=1 Tax=Trypanosoma rangeli TaxID=5698 RepID=A0A422NAJ1_TRYRA|nr:protein phosphatase 2C [Trypanosoma rangeli]RNF02494.1 protein phosphatase 2C [Trypanosoma rangeli]|eukprot:RNF02494.1 protein phosphatase 2C [Trypanosoma rangeli]
MRPSGSFHGNTQTLLYTPVQDKYSFLIEDDKLRVGASSMQGWRSTMEDAHTIHLSLPRLPSHIASEDAAIAAVFDGHCGSKTSQTSAIHIMEWITSTEAFSQGNMEKAICEGFLTGDSVMHKTFPTEASGSTGNCVLIVQNHLYCGNVGDSRAVLCRDGVAIPLSEDHKPNLQREKERILKAKGFIRNGRVNGILSLSRALGDFSFKDSDLSPAEQAVTAKPDVVHMELTPQDEFVIIACDGIWDMVSNERAVEIVRSEVADHSDLSLACERLMEACLSRVSTGGGTDNMTVIILQFKSFFLKKVECKFGAISPKPSE